MILLVMTETPPLRKLMRGDKEHPLSPYLAHHNLKNISPL